MGPVTESRASRQDPPGPTTPQLSVTLGRLQTLCRHQVPFLLREFVCPAHQYVPNTFSSLSLARALGTQEAAASVHAPRGSRLASQGGGNHPHAALRGSAGSWGNVSKGSQHEAGQDVHRAQSPCPQLTSDLCRAYGQNWNGGRAGPGEARVHGAGGTGLSPHCTNGEAGLVPCSGLLRLPEKEPGWEPPPTPWPSAGWLEGSEEGIGQSPMPSTLVQGRAGLGRKLPRGCLSAPGRALLCPVPSQAGGICRVRAWSWLRLGTSWSHSL